MGLEINSSVERRRRWFVADKLRILAEADEPSAKVAEVARRHEISRSMQLQRQPIVIDTLVRVEGRGTWFETIEEMRAVLDD